MRRAKQHWNSIGEHLPVGQLEQPELALYCVEADEAAASRMWSFVDAKDCPDRVAF
ncbi:hypothetical protein [Tunicatimonas pelagia]|uniref:hypothetical protein n=1 Tax=Tunicatimonas pelagia TaxID=931531 RepID=UPI002666A0EF|nr:hypothetical protein [Tunicatimonas pelagia]WKN42075.1 hypothetical protein P0M28_23850 [Tunicatimonas pelagia]